MFGDIVQPTHLLLILAVALIVLGPKRLPEVGRSLGRGLRDFRSGLHGVQDEARGMFSDVLDEPSGLPEDSTVSMVPEPLTPATAEPAATPVHVPAPSAPSLSKVTPVELDPADYAD